MKYLYKILLFFTCLINLNSTIAQNLVSQGNQWNTSTTSWWGGQNTYSKSLKVEGTIETNGYIYSKIIRSSDSLNNEWINTNIRLRQDSSSKIYILENGNESVLYDFSLIIGDTFYIESWDCEIIVTNIDSVQLNNGEKRKRLFLNNSVHPGEPPLEWIEGIGSQFGLTEYRGVYCAIDLNNKLLCFYNNQELLYPANPPNCFETITSAIEPLSANSKVQIMPNPFNNNIFLYNKSENSIIEFRVYSNLGVEINSKLCTQQINQINLEKLIPGAYHVLIRMENGEAYSKTLIKK